MGHFSTKNLYIGMLSIQVPYTKMVFKSSVFQKKLIALFILLACGFTFTGSSFLSNQNLKDNTTNYTYNPYTYFTSKFHKSPIQNTYFELKKAKEEQQYWVDSVLNGLSLEQKIGQLFMIATYSNRNETYYSTTENLIRKYHIGGLVFFQGSAQQQALLTNRYQLAAKTPLLIGIDAEWGLGMRLDNTVSFPKQITLGAMGDTYLIEEMGYEIGLQCKRMGIHINFAPVADINTNPENPIINYRSFGEATDEVALKVAAYTRGLQKAGVLACAKHFPGHGDTDTDSHLSMPVVDKSRSQLFENELKPFIHLIDNDIAAVMTGHLAIPSLTNNNSPATVAKEIVTDLLRKNLNFEGLAITDALNMRGISRQFTPGMAEVAAFKAGNDILLQTANLEAAFLKLKEGFENGTLSEEQLNASVSRILKAKYRVGLNKSSNIKTNNLINDLNNTRSKELKNDIFHKAVTVVRAEKNVFPFQKIDSLKIASISVSAPADNAFQESLQSFANIKNFALPIKPGSSKDWDHIVTQAAEYDAIVVGIHDMNSLANKNFGVSPSTIDMLRKLSEQTKVIVCTFGNPYGLKLFDEFKNLICGYEEEEAAYETVAEILFGAETSKGRLPVTASAKAKIGFGMGSPNLGRLSEDIPENVGMSSDKLSQIDDIVIAGINNNAFPGCQILVARRGKVVYHKSFGTFRYGNSEPVNNKTLYDLASVTKVAATLQAVMLLYERGQLELQKPASYYLPQLKGTNKENLIIQDILLHQAGLKAFLPFWANTVENGQLKPDYFQYKDNDEYLPVSQNLFIKPSIKDDVLQWIIDSEFTTRTDKNGGFKYLYSDLGLIIMQRVVEEIVGQNLADFLQETFYKPLGMSSTLYRPLDFFSKDEIAPTEYDAVFRKSQIWGTVHDPNAALLGGVAGHAGLFSNAWDLAKLFQMNLQGGTYGGRRYLQAETLRKFTANASSKSNRGIGWNKPNTEVESKNIASNASLSTFGHTGFTGSVVWVDPERELVFIMLSNRVYPSANNNKLMQLGIRKQIHETINAAIDLF